MKPEQKDLIFLGRMYGQNAWGNEDAKKIIEWLDKALLREIDKNEKLEMETFSLSMRRNWFERMFSKFR
jgi:hypothetical protein